MYRIKIDRSRCIGCLTCVTACVVSHETESGDARNRVVIDSETKPAPIFCRHCEHPECVYTCMTGAIMKCNMCVHRSEDGKTANPMCVEKCPMHAITLEEVKN